jgi:hypothetical protein
MVRDAFPVQTEYMNGTPVAVLESGMEHVLRGWRLVGSPLPPNSALIQGPFRSLVLEEGISEGNSTRDILLLENALQKTRDLGTREIDPNRKDLGEDYAYMDLDHIRNMIGEGDD